MTLLLAMLSSILLLCISKVLFSFFILEKFEGRHPGSNIYDPTPDPGGQATGR
jgi:hypothetical protein